MEYRFAEIEEKWKKKWEETQLYRVVEDPSKKKFYALSMFPYPSGAGLHVGHPLGYIACDIYARYKRLKGYNVLHPMGFDAFGLPAEQYAIETGTHPAQTTAKAIQRYKEQLNKIGFSYDWNRQIITCEPGYYKWTQWIFLKLFNSWYNREKQKAEPIETLIKFFSSQGCTTEWRQFNPELHETFSAEDWNNFSFNKKERILQYYRLAYRSFTDVNWCPALGCVLANDEVKDGKSERGGFPVERKKMRQWSLRITEYAERLLSGLEQLKWSESIKEQQKNWIGKSEGALIEFRIKNHHIGLTVFTTRPDTIFGATFVAIAPEHDLLQIITTPEQEKEVQKYLTYVKSRTDVERQQEKKVTGCFTGAYAIHPFTGAELPIWTAEYILSGYGTGAIMGVPADDERDKKFAEKFNIPVIEIIDKSMYPNAGIEDKVGIMINSDFLNGMEVQDAIELMLKKVEELKIGKRKTNYKLRDASFSRQRYWGEPFPIRYQVHGEADSPFIDEQSEDEANIPIALDESELPLELPPVESFKPTGDGRSPLAHNKEWVTKKYETDTMPGYAGSSWYFLRYTDPHNQSAFASKEKLDYWGQVDLYIGGSEHAVGHLLYARFFTKVLFDLGYLSFDEPFLRLVNQGMIQGRSAFVFQVTEEKKFISANLLNGNEQGRFIACDISLVDNDKLDIEAFKRWRPEYADYIFITDDEQNFKVKREIEKMSKSKYNVINPDEVIAKYGADTFRLFEMFLGPIELSKPWDEKGISGCYNFLRKLWRLFYDHEGNWIVKDETPDKTELKSLHKLLKKVETDMEQLSFNTSVSAF
ncbi:MAG: leucine--tRNA ligase, partial [Chitinophagales bacterium]|nr:leucine--tRNA ligase [Chitinophagales bacterium]